jgi:hypothetical protein
MAEINYNNLYNQLSPLDKLFYDQQFSKNYAPGQENIMLEMKPGYEQMKAAYEAEQEIPKKSFLDRFNPFSSASAAEMPTVPNLSLGYNMPTFNLGTGITNTKAATNMFSPFMNNQEIVNRDLIEQIIAENQARINPFVRPNMFDIAGGITQTTPMRDLGIDTSYGVANEDDVEQVESLTEKKPSGIENLLKLLIPGRGLANFLSGILPKDSPEIRSMKNFYSDQYGLDSAGRVASGIMAGYNPVYGGLLNMFTGGRFGKPTQFGLANAARQRIENIAKRRAPQTDASGAKIAELQRFAEADTISRARQANPDVYREADKQGFTGPGGGFSTSGREGAFSSKSGRGRQDF